MDVSRAHRMGAIQPAPSAADAAGSAGSRGGPKAQNAAPLRPIPPMHHLGLCPPSQSTCNRAIESAVPPCHPLSDPLQPMAPMRQGRSNSSSLSRSAEHPALQGLRRGSPRTFASARHKARPAARPPPYDVPTPWSSNELPRAALSAPPRALASSDGPGPWQQTGPSPPAPPPRPPARGHSSQSPVAPAALGRAI